MANYTTNFNPTNTDTGQVTKLTNCSKCTNPRFYIVDGSVRCSTCQHVMGTLNTEETE